jgi:hypothetical protein
MSTRRTVGFAGALLLAFLSCGCRAAEAGAALDEFSPSPPGAKVIAYYFHTTVRCTACTRIENLAREVVERDFTEQIKAGGLEWRAVNVQHAENQHFVRDFRLVTKSVVLVREADGRMVDWKNLDKIWELVRNQNRYQNYVRQELASFLGGS